MSTSFHSVSHPNGVSFDIKYLSRYSFNELDQDLINIARDWGFARRCIGLNQRDGILHKGGTLKNSTTANDKHNDHHHID